MAACTAVLWGKDEADQLEEIKKKIMGSVNLAGMLSLEEELAVMSKLDFMIAMDSSNMHMAALVGTKVISIWGGTDPLQWIRCLDATRGILNKNPGD